MRHRSSSICSTVPHIVVSDRQERFEVNADEVGPGVAGSVDADLPEPFGPPQLEIAAGWPESTVAGPVYPRVTRRDRLPWKK